MCGLVDTQLTDQTLLRTVTAGILHKMLLLNTQVKTDTMCRQVDIQSTDQTLLRTVMAGILHKMLLLNKYACRLW